MARPVMLRKLALDIRPFRVEPAVADNIGVTFAIMIGETHVHDERDTGG